eukprot:gene40825-55181_t
MLWDQVSEEELRPVYSAVRDSLIGSLEKENRVRLLFAEKEAKKRKVELTDQLEDAVRNHWPRRGRVETQIKQPRDAELMSVQEKMNDLRNKFMDTLQKGQGDCQRYEQEMQRLGNSLVGDHFKNLAALQGVDAKARGASLSFKASGQVSVTALQSVALTDTQAVVSFAKDFRKVCPPQEPGQSGGYSESELQEI